MTPTTPSEAMRLAEEAKNAAREHACAVFGDAGVDRCCATWDAVSISIDRLRDLAALAGTQAATRPVEAWLPIESAPKVVGRIMGAVDGRARFICWGKASHVPMYGWVLTDQGPEDCDPCEPTHWQPLPTPPAPQADQGAQHG